MMRAALIALCAGLAACATAPSPSTSGPSLPPELQRVLDDYSTAWRAKDAKALAALFADDRTVVPNACPPAKDRAGIEACYTGHGGGIGLTALDHRIDGSMAYIIGEYAGQPGGPAAGKFVLTLTRDAAGRWLIVADMDQPYRRPPPPPAN
jgi:ketosteroid isomerase-like protein